MVAACVGLGLLILVAKGTSQVKPEVDKAHAERVWTGAQIAEIGMGLGIFSESYRRLPYPIRRAPYPKGLEQDVIAANGKGRPLHSWRVETLWVIWDLGWKGPCDDTQPWDSPANRATLGLSDYYSHVEAKDWVGDGKLFPDTNILAITGPGTAFGYDGGDLPKQLDKIPPSTIIAVEVRASGIPWPAPGDFDIRTMPQTICAPDGKGISSRLPRGFFVIFADTGTWFLSDKTPFETLKQLFTIEGAKKNDREKLLGPYVIERGPYSAEFGLIFGNKRVEQGQAWNKRGLEEWEKEQKKAKKGKKP